MIKNRNRAPWRSINLNLIHILHPVRRTLPTPLPSTASSSSDSLLPPRQSLHAWPMVRRPVQITFARVPLAVSTVVAQTVVWATSSAISMVVPPSDDSVCPRPVTKRTHTPHRETTHGRSHTATHTVPHAPSSSARVTNMPRVAPMYARCRPSLDRSTPAYPRTCSHLVVWFSRPHTPHSLKFPRRVRRGLHAPDPTVPWCMYPYRSPRTGSGDRD